MDSMDGGEWTPASRLRYNLQDTISRCTVQVHRYKFTKSVRQIFFTQVNKFGKFCSRRLDNYVSYVFMVFYATFPIIFRHFTGVSQLMDRNLRAFGQCGNVECEVWELGSAVLRPAVLSSCILGCKFMEGWISDPEECSSVWSGIRPENSASISKSSIFGM
jgi:hypothetical protein